MVSYCHLPPCWSHAVPNHQGFPESCIEVARYLNLRYDGTDVAVMTPEPSTRGLGDAEHPASYAAAFEAAYVREFGFRLSGRAIHVDDVRVRAMARGASVEGEQDREGAEAGGCGLGALGCIMGRCIDAIRLDG